MKSTMSYPPTGLGNQATPKPDPGYDCAVGIAPKEEGIISGGLNNLERDLSETFKRTEANMERLFTLLPANHGLASEYHAQSKELRAQIDACMNNNPDRLCVKL